MYKSEVEAFVKTQIGENQYFTPLVIANTLYPTFSYVDKEIGLCSTLYEGILACLRDLELKEVVEGVFKKKTTLLQDMGFVEDSEGFYEKSGFPFRVKTDEFRSHISFYVYDMEVYCDLKYERETIEKIEQYFLDQSLK